MISLVKIILFLGILFVQFSSSSVIPRHGQHQASPSSALGFPTSTNKSSLPVSVSDSDDSDSSCEAGNSNDSDETDGLNGSDSSPVDTPSTVDTVVSVQVPATSAQPTIATYSPVVPTKSASIPATASATANPTSTQAAGEFWQPAAGSTWQIELSGVVSDTSYPADVFDLDLFDTPQSTIDALHAAKKKVICYFSAGSFENWRPDQADFQAADKGSAMEGWEGEWWLNTKTANVRSIMAARIDIAASKGCDAVDPDNVDGYANANGVGLTSADATDYLNFLADTAHAKGLSIGLKNAGDLVREVLDKMQFHVNEQCIEYDECELFKPFIDAGKPVFHIEYPETAPSISSDVKSEKCAAANTMSFSTVLKTEALNAWIDAC
ncbi:hypothetical protein ONS95_002264 [Cadophora gregata]|uniref:uncharacterized protein n=1 Tax=Cadophora gregata TaxID=51156 RepID=UPI0026DCED88|nr:uncharacterized protein ONS95_002264 [Cadophora gregata]KAK0109578.1 hypothetical protein ONS95_002264 [Cadophora gregata]KAK0110790.1 hypothetical protein ONS96_002385 [Cadophora gregata f. sp. sojae]